MSALDTGMCLSDSIDVFGITFIELCASKSGVSCGSELSVVCLQRRISLY